MSAPFAVQSRRVYTRHGVVPACIEIEGDSIVAMRPHGSFQGRVVDYGEALILPGAVDLHVHLNEPGRTAWEGFFTGTAAAIAGGVTTLVDMPLNSSPVTTTPAALAEKRSAAEGRLSSDVAFHGGIIAGAGTEAEALLTSGVVGMKAFLIDSGLPEFTPAGEADLRRLMPTMAELGIPLLAHAELPAPAPAMRDPRSPKDWARSRPPEMEYRAIELLIRLCRETRCAVHIVHVAAAEVLPLIAAAKAEGLPLTAETCPHYLEFCVEEIADGDTRFKCAPPIRDQTNREALWEAVRSGVIDTIGSDHSPCPPSMKAMESGDFTMAWGGISSLELLLRATHAGFVQRGLPLERLVQLLCENPARIIGMENQIGSIAPGSLANLVVLDDTAREVVMASNLRHRHAVTPWEGREMRSRVLATWLRGELAFGDGTVSAPRGRAIDARSQAGLLVLNRAPSQAAEAMLSKCCGASLWWQLMSDARPFHSRAHLMATAEKIADRLSEGDWLEAFSHHPKIGDVGSLRRKFAATAAWSAAEQGSVSAASEEVLARLAAGNEEYEKRFGFIFIVCATGRSAAEMLALLEARIGNDRATDLRNASNEQRKITRLRLDKMLQ